MNLSRKQFERPTYILEVVILDNQGNKVVKTKNVVNVYEYGTATEEAMNWVDELTRSGETVVGLPKVRMK